MLASHRDVVMQYSPNNLVFTISLVDGGTLDLVRGLGKNIVSSGDLVALFEATLTEEQVEALFQRTEKEEGSSLTVNLPQPNYCR